jgi:D-alanine-D-alanine ligase
MGGVARQVVVLYNQPADSSDASDKGVLREVDDVSAALRATGHAVEPLGLTCGNLFDSVSRTAGRRSEAVVFNLCEGLDGDSRQEATVAGLLELRKIRYTGNGPTTLTCALDKRITKALLAAAGVPTPLARLFRSVPRPEVVKDLGFPVVVKPLREDASVGLARESFVRTPEELCQRVAYVLQEHRQPALAEAYLEGREFNLAVVGDGKAARVLPVAEIVFDGYAPHEPRLVTHEAKWQEGSADDRRTVPHCPATVDDQLRARLEALALPAYRALECRDYARIDVRLDAKGRPHVLEVNPNPDISKGAGLARAVAASGEPYEDFVARVVDWAWSRS